MKKSLTKLKIWDVDDKFWSRIWLLGVAPILQQEGKRAILRLKTYGHKKGLQPQEKAAKISLRN